MKLAAKTCFCRRGWKRADGEIDLPVSQCVLGRLPGRGPSSQPRASFCLPPLPPRCSGCVVAPLGPLTLLRPLPASKVCFCFAALLAYTLPLLQMEKLRLRLGEVNS